MKQFLLVIFFITYLCQAQNARVDYYEIKPYPLYSGTEQEFATLYSDNHLKVLEAYQQETGYSYKIIMKGKVLKEWFSNDESESEASIHLYYSPTTKDYYVFLWKYFEDFDWVDAFYVTEQKITYKGQFSYSFHNPTFWNNSGSSFEHVENTHKQEIYTENGNLNIANFIGGDIMRVVKYEKTSSANFPATIGVTNLKTLENRLRGDDDYIITVDLDLDKDDKQEKYRINWKSKKIDYLDDASKELYKRDAKAIRFKQDTLVISTYLYDRMSMPEFSATYRDHYYFVAAPYDNNPVLCKHISSKEIEKYEEGFEPYSFTYYPIEDTRLSNLWQYSSQPWENSGNIRYRIFKPEKLENQLKSNPEYFLTRELPPSAYEIYKLLDKYPLTSRNVVQYNNIAYYLEQLILNHILKMEHGRGTIQYAETLSSATYLLQKILTNFPERTVAHLNMADVLWNNYDKQPAIKYYNSYISLMKKENKQSKIPQRVYERIK